MLHYCDADKCDPFIDNNSNIVSISTPMFKWDLCLDKWLSIWAGPNGLGRAMSMLMSHCLSWPAKWRLSLGNNTHHRSPASPVVAPQNSPHVSRIYGSSHQCCLSLAMRSTWPFWSWRQWFHIRGKGNQRLGFLIPEEIVNGIYNSTANDASTSIISIFISIISPSYACSFTS
jgi:hypothetical protein